MVEQLRGNLIDVLTATRCLGDQPGGEVVRQVLGYRGHWATRSRRYSTTLTALREARCCWQSRTAGVVTTINDEAVVVVATWAYVGSGYRTPGDAWLARTAQEQRLLLRRERCALRQRSAEVP